jgi:hypothetical protein
MKICLAPLIFRPFDCGSLIRGTAIDCPGSRATFVLRRSDFWGRHLLALAFALRWTCVVCSRRGDRQTCHEVRRGDFARALQLQQVPQTVRPHEVGADRDTHSEARCSRLNTSRRTGKKQAPCRHISTCMLMRGTASLCPREADAEIFTSIHSIVHIERDGAQRSVRDIFQVTAAV